MDYKNVEAPLLASENAPSAQGRKDNRPLAIFVMQMMSLCMVTSTQLFKYMNREGVLSSAEWMLWRNGGHLILLLTFISIFWRKQVMASFKQAEPWQLKWTLIRCVAG